jgi:hypothetical protein
VGSVHVRGFLKDAVLLSDDTGQFSICIVSHQQRRLICDSPNSRIDG